MFFKKKKKKEEPITKIEQIPEVGPIQITKSECISKQTLELSDGSKPVIYTNNDDHCVIINQDKQE